MGYTRKTTDLIISEELRSILLEFEHQSDIAHRMLRKRHDISEMEEDHVNFISLAHNDQTRLSYLTSDRIAKIMGAEGATSDNLWTSTSMRYSVKPGGLIKKLFKDVSDKEIEIFSNLFRSYKDNMTFYFQVVEGEEVKKWYMYENYYAGSGSLGNSCMKYDRCQNFLTMYVENPQVVKMLIMLDKETGRIKGRALLWDLGDKKVMDRVYTIDDEKYYIFFKKWAVEKNFFYKKEQKWNNASWFGFGNNDCEINKFEVKLERFNYRFYPYLDTFKFLDFKTGTLYNYNPKEGEGFIEDILTLCAPDGRCLESNYLLYDGVDGNHYYRGDMAHVKYLNMYVHVNKCEYSRVNECYLLKKDAKYIEQLDDFCFTEEYSSFNRPDLDDIIKKYNTKSEKKEKMKKNIYERWAASINPSRSFDHATGEIQITEAPLTNSEISTEDPPNIQSEPFDDINLQTSLGEAINSRTSYTQYIIDHASAIQGQRYTRITRRNRGDTNDQQGELPSEQSQR